MLCQFHLDLRIDYIIHVKPRKERKVEVKIPPFIQYCSFREGYIERQNLDIAVMSTLLGRRRKYKGSKGQIDIFVKVGIEIGGRH